MPEGDTIYRAAAALRTALVGKVTHHFETMRVYGPQPRVGSVIERVESHGKHLEMTWDDGVVLHTHMRMTGSWHLYRDGERWRAPHHHARAIIGVSDWTAVCFNAPTVEMYREPDRHRHPGFGRLGPDLCRPDADLAECVRRLMHYNEPERTIAEVLLDQRIACGVGNVFKAEVLYACGVSPFTPVKSVDAATAAALIETSASMLRANLQASHRITAANVPGGVAVYGRTGQACFVCHTTVRAKRHGELARTSYWCPSCQPGVQPDPTPAGIAWPIETAMSVLAPMPEADLDGEPAAVVFLGDQRRGRHPDSVTKPQSLD